MLVILLSLLLMFFYLLGFPQESRWNFLFVFLALPTLLQLCVLPYVPGHPDFLLMEKKDEAIAEKGKFS